MDDVTLAAVGADYRVLDSLELTVPDSVRLISHEPYISPDGLPEVEAPKRESTPTRLRVVSLLRDLLLAWRTLRRADERSAVICNFGGSVGKLICVLNAMNPFARKKIVVWESHVQTASPLKRMIIRCALRHCSRVVVYSRRLKDIQAKYLCLPKSKFVFLPYKANHSKEPPLWMPIGSYAFSGGNSSRDYRTLFEAVRGTGRSKTTRCPPQYRDMRRFAKPS